MAGVPDSQNSPHDVHGSSQPRRQGCRTRHRRKGSKQAVIASTAGDICGKCGWRHPGSCDGTFAKLAEEELAKDEQAIQERKKQTANRLSGKSLPPEAQEKRKAKLERRAAKRADPAWQEERRQRRTQLRQERAEFEATPEGQEALRRKKERRQRLRADRKMQQSERVHFAADKKMIETINAAVSDGLELEYRWDEVPVPQATELPSFEARLSEQLRLLGISDEGRHSAADRLASPMETVETGIENMTIG